MELKFGGAKGGDIQMSLYVVDADHASCIDNRRLVSGGEVMLAGAAMRSFRGHKR